jgi:hypothetical protein
MRPGMKLVAIAILLLSCGKTPRWTQEFQIILNKLNFQLETAASQLATHSQPSNTIIAMNLIDAALDELTPALKHLLNKYPELSTQNVQIERQLSSELKRLRLNMRRIYLELRYWHPKRKADKQFLELMEKIGRKAQEADAIIGRPK